MTKRNITEKSDSKKDFKKNNERREKALVIEGMLEQLDMSKQELVDLINSILFAEKSEEVEIINEKIFVSESKNLSSDEVSVAEEMSEDSKSTQGKDRKHISELLSLEALKHLLQSIKLSINLQKLEKLGLKPDLAKISSILQISAITALNNNGSIDMQNRAQSLKTSQLVEINDYLASEIAKNSQSQVSSFISKTVGSIKDLASKTTGKLKDTIHMLDYQADMIRMKQSIVRIESSARELKTIERAIKERFPEISKISYSNKTVMAAVEGMDKPVNLEGYLEAKNLLTADVKRMIDDAGSANSELMKMLSDFKREAGLPQDTKLAFSKNARLFIEAELKNTKKTVHISDYIGDIKKLQYNKENVAKSKAEDDQNALKLALEEKGQGKENSEMGSKSEKESVERSENVKKDLQKLDAQRDNESRLDAGKDGDSKFGNSERAKDLDKYNEAQEQRKDSKKEDLSLEAKAGGDLASESGEVVQDGKSEKGKVEAAKAKDSVVKQDVIADKAKMMEGMREVQSLMKEGLKDMDKAMKNKDMLKDMEKQMQKDKMLDK